MRELGWKRKGRLNHHRDGRRETVDVLVPLVCCTPVVVTSSVLLTLVVVLPTRVAATTILFIRIAFVRS